MKAIIWRLFSENMEGFKFKMPFLVNMFKMTKLTYRKINIVSDNIEEMNRRNEIRLWLKVSLNFEK